MPTPSHDECDIGKPPSRGRKGEQPSVVRAWWATFGASAPATAAGAYRLLSTICNSAVTDQVIARSPCIIKGTGRERSPEKPTASIAEVAAAIEAVPVRYRLALLLTAWCQLRRSEILGLQRRDIDELHGELRVERAFVSHSDGSHAIGQPKTEAGRRTIAIPQNVVPLLTAHLAEHVGPHPDRRAHAQGWPRQCGGRPPLPARDQGPDRALADALAALSQGHATSDQEPSSRLDDRCVRPIGGPANLRSGASRGCAGGHFCNAKDRQHVRRTRPALISRICS